MRVIAIADDDSLVCELPFGPVDLLLCLGDLCDSTIEKAYARYLPRKVLAVRGNHDSSSIFPAYVTPMHYTIEKYEGLSFGGFDGSWRYKPRGNYLFDQDEVSVMMRHFPYVDVFIAHNSPKGIHERDDHTHQGFDGFLSYIDSAKPRYFIHGHQHFNTTSKIGETQVISVFGEKELQF
jgi:uncharacterized protein